ncbi:hypothetical protein F9817_00860 [Vibrio sp. CAIM 722]|uniref:Hemerythrin-like domain-containing protein n=1 Tax=Vibrio eleionomae TaxID=2653505 RepID=A0A7X4LH22_9VIBR|nr:hemerythrin domain-containing protein [Vibrio eleionomae]MZI91757.1 hypothetical protein [Vibrio eleionomae]
MMIERIRREHGYMVRLLAILRHKFEELRAEQGISYSLVKEIVDYLATHSEAIHHPKEDIIYRYYIDKYGVDENMANLEKEHLSLAEKTHEFLNLVEMILQDAIVPQDVFLKQLEGFIVAQKQHLDLEEQSVLPKINQTFSAEDWQTVESMWSQNESDPLFGETIADRYKQIAQLVRATDLEYH